MARPAPIVRLASAIFALSALACGEVDPRSPHDAAPPPHTADDASSPVALDADGPGDGGASTALDAEPPLGTLDASAPAPTPTRLTIDLRSRDLVCKLISGGDLELESDNHTHTRFNLRGTDLGTPAIIGDQLHLFFGDTHGYRRIWRVGEDPDSVARVSLARARADLSVLCRELDFYVTRDVPSVAAGEDARVLRDFEGAYLGPPAGHAIREYVDRPRLESPDGAFPGSFEVPTGAITHGGSTYVLYSTRTGTGSEILDMRSALLTRWESAGASPLFYRILGVLDDLDRERALGGHFIQNAPLVRGEHLYLFGTGPYRKDGVHLARKPASGIADPGGYELYDPRTDTWTLASSLDAAARAAIPAIVDEGVRGIGELGVQYVEEAGLYVMMYQQLSATSGGNRMVMQVALRPEGPWTGTTIILMHDPIFMARHCCLAELTPQCQGERIIRCDRGGLYGIYPLPLIRVTAMEGGYELEVPFVASTWVPYNVALFRARVFVRPVAE